MYLDIFKARYGGSRAMARFMLNYNPNPGENFKINFTK